MAEQEHPPIKVGIDGLETGRRALHWALREAQIRQCGVHVIHAWVFDPVVDFVGTYDQRPRENSEMLLRREVEQATSDMTNAPPITRKSIKGDAGHVLTDESRGAAMLVVGSHQGGVFRRAVLGSVSTACVRHAHCPVVVIPAIVTPDEESDQSQVESEPVPQS